MVGVWRHIVPTRRRQHSALPAVTAFRALAQKERARVDRFGGTFCLVAFDVGNTHPDDTFVDLLSAVVQVRKRQTDEIGWPDNQHLGVLLPGTTASGARCFAEEICRAIGKTGAPPRYQIAQYPPASLQQVSRPETLPSEANQPAVSTGPAADPARTSCSQPEASWSGVPAVLGQSCPVWKRTFDILLSGAVLVCLLPLFLVIALLILIVSPGPVFFAQERVGYLGRKFHVWKFRTMRCDADSTVHRDQVTREIGSDDPLTKLDNSHDPRVIPLGKWLRMTGLDELPQLFNVLRGDMSLIGPRPDPVYAADHYQPWHTARLDVLPGITGLWQVSGKNRTTFKQMIRLDVAYARRLSLWLDLKIMLKTLPAIVGQVRDTVCGAQEGVQAPPSR